MLAASATGVGASRRAVHSQERVDYFGVCLYSVVTVPVSSSNWSIVGRSQ
jgi:hypothetical protein